MDQESETFIAVHNVDEYEALYDANQDAFDAVGDYDRCFALACNCELRIGGGAAPLFRIGFVD